MTSRPTFLSLMGPLITGLAALFLAMAPFYAGNPWLQGPHWLLAALLFWATRRPWSTPPLLVFALGLTADLLRDGPIGAELFALLLVVEGTRAAALRRPPAGVSGEILRILLAVVVFELVVAALLAATYAPMSDIFLTLQRALATILLYPLCAYTLQKLTGARLGDGRFAHLG